MLTYHINGPYERNSRNRETEKERKAFFFYQRGEKTFAWEIGAIDRTIRNWNFSISLLCQRDFKGFTSPNIVITRSRQRHRDAKGHGN